MFNHRRHSKIKNKILRWCLELAQYDYDIIYRAGKHNCVPKTIFKDKKLTHQTMASCVA